MKIRLSSLDAAVRVAIAVGAATAIGLLIWLFRPVSITVTNQSVAASSLTGLPCEKPTRRPIAVMFASDPQARPLSGIGQADVVVEMPVTPDGITRMMAVFQCGQDPKEIGSIRSARMDFIPLAQGFGAILAHWGGEREALEKLNKNAMDNIDGLSLDGTVFYRKSSIPRPHNGFTTLALLRDQANAFGYAASSSISGWPHTDIASATNISALADAVTIPWPGEMAVKFLYDAETRSYMRWRGGTPETDTTTGLQVRVSAVIVIETTSSFVRDQYISVRTTGQGTVAVYQRGQKTTGTWTKKSDTDMLTFTDAGGKAIPLSPGQVWIIVHAPSLPRN